jgi:tripartite-type tricarboxylate transporter receptor subunit TctC
MELSRRQLLQLAVGAAGLPAMSRSARAQTYPTRPVRVIVGFAAGGTQDIVARLIFQWLSDRLGQQFVIENRPGAGGNIAAAAVVRAPADGYTILLVGLSNAVNATLYDNLGYNFIRDIAPVAGIMRLPNLMAVNPSVPVRTVPEFIAYAKANPGKVNFASAGNGAPNHVALELFKMMVGVDIVHVPYRGGAGAVSAAIGGHVQGLFESIPVAIEYIKADQLRALGVSSAARLDVLPDVPPIGDFLPGFEASGFYGVGVPRNTPAEIIATLNGQVNAALVDAKVRARLVELGGTVLGGSPADFGELIVEETEKWAKVIRATHLRAE